MSRPYIHVGKDLVLTADKRQWITARRQVYEKGEREGEEYLAHQKFHSTLEDALNVLMDRIAKQSDAESLEELMCVVLETRDMIEDAVEAAK